MDFLLEIIKYKRQGFTMIILNIPLKLIKTIIFKNFKIK